MIRARNRILRSTFCLLLAIIAVAAVVLQYTSEGAFAASGTPSATTTTSITPPTYNPTPRFTVLDGVNPSNNANEGYAKLFDGNSGTKYCISIDNDPYVVFKSSTYGTKITGYKLYTGNDTASHEGRNPKDWTLYGSNNYDESAKTGDWTPVHTVTNDTKMGAANNTAYSFTVENTNVYKYFKFEFTARRGADSDIQEGYTDSSIQLAEIEIQATVDTSPASLRALSTVEYGTLSSMDTGKYSAAQSMYDGDLDTYCARDDVQQIYDIKPPTGVVIYGARVYLHSSTTNNSDLVAAYFQRQRIMSGATDQFADYTAFTKKDSSYISVDGMVYTLFVENSTKQTVYRIDNEWIPASQSIYVAEVEPLYRYECEHSFTADYSAAVEATCDRQGARAYRTCDYGCGVCQYKNDLDTEKYCESEQFQYEITVPCIEHTYGDWTNEVAPSCTQAGCYKHRQCTGCSAYEYVDGSGEAKACASTEYDSKIKLAACHTFGAWVPYKPNTCTEDGNHWYRKCSKCDVYEWFILINPNADPDAYLAEHTGGRKTTTDFSEITRDWTAGHTWSTTQLAAAKEPSCTEDGNYEWKRCSRCNGYQYTIGESTYFCAEDEFDTKVKLPKHHTWGSVVQGTAPTCEEAGSVAYRQCTATGCGKCQYSYGKHTVENDYFDTTTDSLYIIDSVSGLPTISKLSHAPVLVKDSAAPTCTEYGNRTYYYCDRCKQYKYYVDGTEYFCSATEEAYNTYIRRDKIEHTYGTLIAEAPASCTETGMAAHYECSECHGLFDASKAQKTEQELTLAINPSNHVYATSCSKRCSKCTQERPDSERVHRFDKNGSAALVNGNTEQHTYFCTNDNCPDGALNEDHTMVLAYAQDGAYKHWYKCSKQGCTYETSKINCVIKYESKDKVYHVSYCEISEGERHELGANGARNTENHSWTLTFKQDKYDAGEGTYHDSYCAVCNTWKGEETACNLSYKSDSTDHWRECSACKKSGLDKQAHSFVMLYDDVDHWERCTVCELRNGGYIKHIFESETSAGCSETRCGYQRFLSAEISVSGYTIDAPVGGLKASGTTNRADTRLTPVKYILLDSDANEIDLDRGFKFRPNSIYYASLSFDCGDVYPSLDMTAGDFSLPDGFELGHYYIDIDDSTNNVILSLFVTLPALGGVSAEKSVSEMEIDIKGFAEGKTLGDVTVGITCKGLPTDKSFTVKHKSYSSIKGTETDKTVIGNTSYSIRMILEAPDGFSFYGLTDSDITVKNNMGTAYMAPMSEESKISSDGKSITVTVVINSLVPEHVCGVDGWDIIATLYDFLCPDRTKQHTRMCKTCAAIEFVNHVYTYDTDTECDECHYTRTLRLDEMKITLTGYESDKALGGISASYNGKYSGVISISTEYAPRIVDLDTGYTYSKKATFVPGKTYGLMLELNIPSSIDISNCTLDNVYVNGTKVKVVLGMQDDTAAMYVLELPAVKGESEQTKVSDVTLEVSGFVPGASLNDVSNNCNDHPGIDGVGIIVTENGNAMSGTDVFAYGKQYVLKVTYFLKNGYYGTGVTAADLKVSHYAVSGSQKTDLGSFECIGITVDDFGDPDTDKRTITCEYLVVLDIPAVGEEEHSHSFPTENPQYHTDEGKHYVLCGCGARAEGQAHVYEEDDLFTCTVCGYERVYSAERLELEISDWHVGNYSNSILRSSGFYIDGNEVLFNEDGYSDWSLNIMAAILCEGKITDLSLEQLKKAEVVLAGKNYSLVIMLAVDPDYLSLGALTEKDYIIKGIGKTDITASVVLNIFSFGYPLVALFFDIPATEAKHIHGGTWIDGAPASCTEAGTKGYYVCTVCGDKFDAENVKIDDLTIGALGHSFGTWIDEAPATLEKDGAVAHKDCERCGKHFDANGNEIADKDYTIAKIPGYNLIFTVDGKQAARYYLAQGSAVTYPTENTSKEGFTFAWSQTIETMPNKDVTIDGVFSVDVNYFKGKVNAVQSASTVEDIYSAAAEATAALALYKDADTQAISADIAQLEALVNQYKQTAQNAASDIADTLKVLSAVFAAPVQTTVVAFTADIDKRRLL